MFRSYVEVLCARATDNSNARVYRFLETGDADGGVAELTYGDLLQGARAIGAELQGRNMSGRHALLLFPPGLDFAEAFFGCLFGGAVAVPMPLPELHNLDRALRRLKRIVSDARIQVVLTTRLVMDGLDSVLTELPELGSLTWIATDEVSREGAGSWTYPSVGPDTTAFLQYTSGSTSAPRGVIVSHRNLLRNQEAIAEAMGHTPSLVESWEGDLFGSWLPVYHDMGLIGPILHTVYMGCSAVLMSPLHFLQDPLRWPRMMSEFGIHSSGAPNFGYELCARRATGSAVADMDLSRWNMAFNGAEPVRPSTLHKFAEKFAAAGFRREALLPVYGLAEATLLVTGGAGGVLGRGPRTVSLDEGGSEWVSSGKPSRGNRIAIVDPDSLIELSEDAVGEIWVGGDSVAGGYLGDTERTVETFGAALSDGRGPYLRTGDLGFVHDGELFVTGRQKDLLILDGKNHYPQDIELTVESAHPAVRSGCVAVFSTDSRDRGEVPVIVAEVKTSDNAELEEIEASVRSSVSTGHEIPIGDIVLIPPRTIFKTSSGKIQRHATRAAYLAGDLVSLSLRAGRSLAAGGSISRRSATETASSKTELVKRWLIQETATQCGIDPDRIDVDQPLAELGFGSRGLVELTVGLSELLDRRVDPSLVFDYPSIAAIADVLGSAAPGPSQIGPPRLEDPSASSAVAIVSMACRFPGANNPDELWNLLVSGTDIVDRVPDDRWPSVDLFDLDSDAPGKAYTLNGGFLSDIDMFDASFFGISAQEACAMDPQQRILLETAWELIERAGRDPRTLAGTMTGVYLGLYDSGYLANVQLDDLNGHVGTGNASSVASGRIAYSLGLQGPAVSIDTACSSSLVALHTAVRAIREGDCELAIAGGVSVMVAPRPYVEFSRLGALSRSGRCRPFSEDADGIVWGEGCGLVFLKRLEDAVRDGDHVLAVVRGSAVNQDGRSQGLSAPSGVAQEAVIRAALTSAGMEPAEIDYVEAHGTGTKLGDPIELGALTRIFGSGQATGRPLPIGSLKSNLGHTQAAAGIAGVIKTVLSLQHEYLPPTLHADRPTPRIRWQDSGLEVQQQLTPWRRGERRRRAGVSAFGISGTNAHVILEEAPIQEAQSEARDEVPFPLLIPLSARTRPSLVKQAKRLAAFLESGDGHDLPVVARSLALYRTHFERRAVLIAATKRELVVGLDSLVNSVDSPHLMDCDRPGRNSGKLAFVFPGQGSQWISMGVDLLERSTPFSEELGKVDAEIHRLTGWSVIEVLRGKDGAPSLSGDDVVQPVLFAVMVGLAAHWQHLGVVPDAVVGHSQGEVAAAYVAGGLSLRDAATTVVTRSRALPRISGAGAMAVVGLPADELEPRLDAAASVAAVNGPRLTVVAGERRSVEKLLEELDREQIFNRLLNVDYASHTDHVEALHEELTSGLSGIGSHPTTTTWYSTVTSGPIGESGVASDYWYRNLREPVRFYETVSEMLNDGFRFFLEMSPHPALTTAVQTIGEALRRDLVVVGSLRRDEDGSDCLRRAQAELYVNGFDLDWSKVFDWTSAVSQNLPTYAWDGKSYWMSAHPRYAPVAGIDKIEHPFVSGLMANAATGGITGVGAISLDAHPWLADHAVAGAVLLPGTAFVELATCMGREIGCDELRELILRDPLNIPADGEVAIQVSVGPADDVGDRTVSIHGRMDGSRDWTEHARGVLSVAEGAERPSTFGGQCWPPDGAVNVDLRDGYEELAARGYAYGPTFQGLRGVWTLDDAIYAEISLAGNADEICRGFQLHPAVLDAALHALVFADGAAHDDRVLLPFAWSGVRVFSCDASPLRARLVRTADRQVHVSLTDACGTLVAEIKSLELREVPLSRLTAAQHLSSLFRVDWAGVNIAVPDGRVSWSDIDMEGLSPSGIPVMRLGYADNGTTRVACETVLDVLRQAQAALAQNTDKLPLVVVTCRAVAVGEEDVVDLPYAPAWGLLRSAQSENPGKIVLVDIENWRDVAAAIAIAATAEEPQLAIRSGRVFAPQLVAASGGDSSNDERRSAGDGTVLITGGTGSLGRMVARHFVERHGAKNLLLVSRQGILGAGADELKRDLEELGASVQIASCDVADRDALADLLRCIPPTQPLTDVVHTAGVLRDATFMSVTPEELAETFRSKAMGAWNLHELTLDQSLSSFVMFSSAAGVLGSLGQASYAAANTFLDALAYHRKHLGLPGSSLAWGLWSQKGGMTGGLGEGDVARIGRSGVGALTPEEGLALLDIAMRGSRPHLVPMKLQVNSLPPADVLPSILRALAPMRRRSEGRPAGMSTSDLAERLKGLSDGERYGTLLQVVRSLVAAVLGHTGPEDVDAERSFQDLGFDSLTAVELRNRLKSATGVTLPTTIVFDYPTPAALTKYIIENIDAYAGISSSEDDQIWADIRAIPLKQLRDSGLLEKLLSLSGAARSQPTSSDVSEEAIDSMEKDDLIALALSRGGSTS